MGREGFCQMQYVENLEDVFEEKKGIDKGSGGVGEKCGLWDHVFRHLWGATGQWAYLHNTFGEPC